MAALDIGQFALINRGGEWDEVLVIGQLGAGEWLCYTTDPSGLAFHWTAIRVTIGNVRILNDITAARAAPANVMPGSRIG